jgi:uncharacterized protein (TIGR02677 family)
MPSANTSAELFRHVSAEKAGIYRSIMASFAAAKRQFRLHMRPDEVLTEARWTDGAPKLEEVQAALAQLAEWGNLEAQPDTARVASISDFYRARFLYRLSHGGDAVETALAAFADALERRAELQTIALEDIASRLQDPARAGRPAPAIDAAKLHETLRDLVRVFEGLADNAQAFMAGMARSIELQQADATAVVAYKQRLIDYLERFIGDLVGRFGAIARTLPRCIRASIHCCGRPNARRATPLPADQQAQTRRSHSASRRGVNAGGACAAGSSAPGHEPPQAEVLRSKARAAIPQLLAAVAA